MQRWRGATARPGSARRSGDLMSKKRLIRRMVVGAVALALTSTVIVGGGTTSPTAQADGTTKTLAPVKTMRMDGAPPPCPSNGSSLTPTRTYPTNGVYRGVIMCYGTWGGDEFYMQLIDLVRVPLSGFVSYPHRQCAGYARYEVRQAHDRRMVCRNGFLQPCPARRRSLQRDQRRVLQASPRRCDQRIVSSGDQERHGDVIGLRVQRAGDGFRRRGDSPRLG